MTERIVRAAAALLAVTSVLLILAAGNLFFAAWFFSTEQKWFWALCWTAGGLAFAAYGIVTLLGLARRIAAPAMDLLRPVLKLGAITLALVGAAWPIQTEIRWQETRDFEAYGVVIGLIMLAQGVAAYWWLERPTPEKLAPGVAGKEWTP